MCSPIAVARACHFGLPSILQWIAAAAVAAVGAAMVNVLHSLCEFICCAVQGTYAAAQAIKLLPAR